MIANSPSGFNGATAFRRWIPGRHALCAGGKPASMGPPPFGDGYPATAPRARWSSTCFNGATAFRRWIPEKVRYVLRRDQWSRFNGATAFQRWTPGKREEDAPLHTASMGPPPFSDGYKSEMWLKQGHFAGLQWGHRLSAMDSCRPDTGTAGPRTASMGPPPFGDGYIEDFNFIRLTLTRLQWGHRLSAMDTAIHHCLPSYSNVKVLISTRND